MVCTPLTNQLRALILVRLARLDVWREPPSFSLEFVAR